MKKEFRIITFAVVVDNDEPKYYCGNCHYLKGTKCGLFGNLNSEINSDKWIRSIYCQGGEVKLSYLED